MDCGPKNLIRHQVSSLLMAHRPRDVLSKVERDALKELRADNDLVIVPADKGRSTVVLDRTDYNQKVKSLLEDRQSYVPCESNPMKTLTREINATLLAMENSGAISPIDRRMARAQETALARFYGLPNVHKEGAPLRPIVSLKGTPTYGLAKWLLQRLKFLTSDSNTTDLAVEPIELLLREKYDETDNRLGHAQIIQLLKFCLKTYFTFEGTIYEQVKGTPMGSPILGLIAEAVLQRLESLVFRQHRPKFWARYVDDTFVVIERDQVLTFKEQLNAVFPDIQFTMEEDVLVCHKDCGGLKTKVFRKVTNTTQILNFNSNHPISHKRNFVRALYRRVETRCSDMEDKVAELQYLRRVSAQDRQNDCPARLQFGIEMETVSFPDGVLQAAECMAGFEFLGGYLFVDFGAVTHENIGEGWPEWTTHCDSVNLSVKFLIKQKLNILGEKYQQIS
nr:unnamed protein product [Spirometra erinaceieuropaei]